MTGEPLGGDGPATVGDGDEPVAGGGGGPESVDPGPHPSVDDDVNSVLQTAAELGLTRPAVPTSTARWVPDGAPAVLGATPEPQPQWDPREAVRRFLAADSDPIMRAAAAASAPISKMEWRARLPRTDDIPEPVHDGDSLWMETDQGDWYRKVRDCRLLDTWAPELKQPGGPETREYVLSWVATWNVGRWPFVVVTFQTGSGRDITTFNRYVTQVWNATRTRCLNADVSAFVAAHGYGGGSGS